MAACYKVVCRDMAATSEPGTMSPLELGHVCLLLHGQACQSGSQFRHPVYNATQTIKKHVDHKLRNANEEILCSNACKAEQAMANLHSGSYLGLVNPGFLLKLSQDFRGCFIKHCVELLCSCLPEQSKAAVGETPLSKVKLHQRHAAPCCKILQILLLPRELEKLFP